MCQKCLDALDKYFPGASDEKRDFIIWEKTAFPAGTCETIIRQIEEFAREVIAPKGDGE